MFILTHLEIRVWGGVSSVAGTGQYKSRSFDYGVHDSTVNTFAQDDTSRKWVICRCRGF